MLTQIHIRDLATIEELQLTLKNGCTMITGETGAGKSIFIEAIELALGGRASPNLIRAGKEKAEISLCFDITSFPKVTEYLKSSDLYQDSSECIIRRVMTSDGRSRCYINGSPATLQSAKDLGELLFHLHGQYEQQVLLKTENQREMLDRFGNMLPLAARIKESADSIRHLEQEIKHIQEKSLERSERSDYLRYQLTELQAIQLQSGEWATLETEHKRLTHAGELMRNIQAAIQQISGDGEQDAQTQLHDIRKTLENMQAIEPKSLTWIHSIQSIEIQLADLGSELQNYLESTELDPERLQAVEERVSSIFNLARKHKVKPEELFAFTEKLTLELDSLESSDDHIKKLETQLKSLRETHQDLAAQLSMGRKKAATKFEKEITETIRSLSLPHGVFKIDLEPDTTPYASHGNEKINFKIKTNPDQALQPLAKVISGGELSRLSLAAHLALAHKTTIPTLVFDEVDTGLSGATAEKIGRLLRKLGESYQVYCVTHQPQVAACGHHHLLVEKYFTDKITHTRLRLLENKDKTTEIARMLGGEKITQTTLKHAQEILENT